MCAFLEVVCLYVCASVSVWVCVCVWCEWVVVYKLKCLNICISFCLRLSIYCHLILKGGKGGMLQSFCGYDIGFWGRFHSIYVTGLGGNPDVCQSRSSS